MRETRRIGESELREAMDRYAMGAPEAFAALYDGLAPRLRAMLRRQHCDAALTEDLIQETFIRIHRARGHYQRGQEVLPWAFAIARRLLIDVWRKDKREGCRPTGMTESPPGPEEEAIAGETAQRLARRLDEMAPSHREAFDLVKLDGLSLEQTAQVLGTSVTAIKLRIHRAYQNLRGGGQEAK